MKNKFCLRCQQSLHQRLKWMELWAFQSLKENVICKDCKNKFIATTKENSCQFCQHPLAHGQTICKDCERWSERYGDKVMRHFSMYLYNDAFKEWITDYKYRLDIRQAGILIEPLQTIYQQYQKYYWTFLPSSTVNLEKRGFNQIEYLLQLANIPYQKLFKYTGDSISQAQKNKEERICLKQPFELIDKRMIKEQQILILDDVYTTGSTLMKAKQLLIEAEVEQCMSITLARDTMK